MATASPSLDAEADAVATALRVSIAAGICVLVTEWLHLDLGYLGVFTSIVIMAPKGAYSSFQKGMERILGRTAAVLGGLFLVMTLRETVLLFLLLLAIFQIVTLYISLSGQFAYATLQACAFIPAVAQAGLTSTPEKAFDNGFNIFAQVVLGVFASEIVNFLVAAETSGKMAIEGKPLLPLRGDWLNHAAMTTTASLLTMFATLLWDLPVAPAIVSATLLAMMPNPDALARKALQRAQGVILGGIYGFLCLFVVIRLPSLLLLLVFVMIGLFASAYVARASKTRSYVGLQTAVALAMVLVGSDPGPGSEKAAITRFIGVVVGFVISVTVEVCWPYSSLETA